MPTVEYDKSFITWAPGSTLGFFQQFWEKAPGQNWEKMIDLTSNWEKFTT